MAIVWGQSTAAPKEDAPNIARCLTLLAEGAASGMPEVDGPAYAAFREAISVMSRRIGDRQADDDKLPVVKDILREFDNYRKSAESQLRDRQNGWRALVSGLLQDLLATMGIDAASSGAAPLVQRVPSLLTGEEIQAFRVMLADFLRVGAPGKAGANRSALRVANRSIANDNAAGLRGGGAAVEHLRRILDKGGSGFVVQFRLGCMDVIGERFGSEAVQDSLMAVSAFLTHTLRSDDALYHWSDSSLLAMLESPASEQILVAAMQRIVNNNRDITIKMGDRAVMLRIPLTFELTPVFHFKTAEDLLKLSRERVAAW